MTAFKVTIMTFEDVRLCDLLTKVQRGTDCNSASQIKQLGTDIQAVYDFVITSQNDYTKQQPMLKNMFSAFNYAAVIINDALKKDSLDREGTELLKECLEIIFACCENVKKSLGEQ